MRKSTQMMLATAAVTAALFAATPGVAQAANHGHSADGAAMERQAPTGTVVDAAVASADHTTLVTAVKAAGLDSTLSGTGPFTVFAPVNAAFAKLPAGTVDGLLKPEAKDQLTGVLTYHVVGEKLTAADIETRAAANNGKAVLTTVQGGDITLEKATDGSWSITDAKGGTAKITAADLVQSNGTLFVIDSVLMP